MTSSTGRCKLAEFLSNYPLPSQNFEDFKASAREQVDKSTLSSFSKEILQLRLDQYQSFQESKDCYKANSSLASISAATILNELSKSKDIEEDLKTIADTLSATALRQLLRDPRAPYHVLRAFHSLPHSYVTRDTADQGRRAVDIDESLLRNERYIRFGIGLANTDGKYLLRLKEFANIVAPGSDPGKPIAFTREDPPEGGLEVLDAYRRRTMQIQQNDDAYRNMFERVTKGALRGLDWDNILVAGNTALNALLDADSARVGDPQNSHIDVFLYGLTPVQANRKVAQIHDVWHRNLSNKEVRVLKSNTAIDFIAIWPSHSVHIVLKLFQSPTDILVNFHLDAYAIGYDGRQVLMLPRCARALETGYSIFTMDLIWDHSHFGGREPTQEWDIFVHAYCGFGLRILPCYAQSLEDNTIATKSLTVNNADITENFAGNWSMPSYRRNAGAGEHGLKTLKRIAYKAGEFVQRFQGAEIELDDLFDPSLTPRRNRLPGLYPGMDSFESFMRCCEAWTLHNCQGLKLRERINQPYRLSQIVRRVASHIDELFSSLRGVISRELGHNIGIAAYRHYLTRRIRDIVCTGTLAEVMRLQITIPMIIPQELENYILNSIPQQYNDLPGDFTIFQPIIPVHDPAEYRNKLRAEPQTNPLPSVHETATENGNLRYWLITNESMWAGQHHASDEMANLFRFLCKWFEQAAFTESSGSLSKDYGTDSEGAVFHMAWSYKLLSLTLPDKPTDELPYLSDGTRTGCLSLRQSSFFRSWVDQSSLALGADDDLMREGNSLREHHMDHLFWNEGDEGVWDEDGAPPWIKAGFDNDDNDEDFN